MTAVYAIAAGTWVGSILFQASVVAPGVFTTLDETQAGPLLRRLFPRLFRLGLICGLAMAASVAALAFAAGWSALLRVLMMLAAAMIVTQLVSLWLVPRINAARDLGAGGAARFSMLHRISVILALAALLFAATAVVLVASRANLVAGTV